MPVGMAAQAYVAANHFGNGVGGIAAAAQPMSIWLSLYPARVGLGVASLVVVAIVASFGQTNHPDAAGAAGAVGAGVGGVGEDGGFAGFPTYVYALMTVATVVGSIVSYSSARFASATILLSRMRSHPPPAAT
jgi:hypothetical protein